LSHQTAVLERPQPVSPSDGEDLCIAAPAGLRLVSGEPFPDSVIRGRLYGPACAPVVIVAGGISAGRRAWASDGSGWWNEVAAPGGGVDLDRWRVLAFDFAPTADVRCLIDTHDQAAAAAALLDAIGVRRAHAWVGASYGAMVGLAFAARHPERLGRLAAISGAERPSAMSLAWRGIQRRVFEFACDAGKPEEGLALARQLAMTTYRSAEEFEGRFDRTLGDDGLSDLCRYLVARGEAYPRRMGPQRWWSLSRSLDTHAVDPAAVDVPATLIASSTDQIAPLEQMRSLAARLPRLERLEVIDSAFGHDAFLKEAPRLNPILRNLLSAEPTA
jgi:homoserine O-acetyltransferase